MAYFFIGHQTSERLALLGRRLLTLAHKIVSDAWTVLEKMVPPLLAGQVELCGANWSAPPSFEDAACFWWPVAIGLARSRPAESKSEKLHARSDKLKIWSTILG